MTFVVYFWLAKRHAVDWRYHHSQHLSVSGLRNVSIWPRNQNLDNSIRHLQSPNSSTYLFFQLFCRLHTRKLQPWPSVSNRLWSWLRQIALVTMVAAMFDFLFSSKCRWRVWEKYIVQPNKLCPIVVDGQGGSLTYECFKHGIASLSWIRRLPWHQQAAHLPFEWQRIQKVLTSYTSPAMHEVNISNLD